MHRWKSPITYTCLLLLLIWDVLLRSLGEHAPRATLTPLKSTYKHVVTFASMIMMRVCAIWGPNLNEHDHCFSMITKEPDHNTTASVLEYAVLWGPLHTPDFWLLVRSESVHARDATMTLDGDSLRMHEFLSQSLTSDLKTSVGACMPRWVSTYWDGGYWKSSWSG